MIDSAPVSIRCTAARLENGLQLLILPIHVTTKNIMKLSKICSFAVLSIAAGAPAWAAAQQPANPGPPPPRLEKLEEVEAPAVTAKKPGEDNTEKAITEKREQGRVTEVKVHSGGSTYYLRPKNVGTSQPGDAESGPPTGAQWNIKEFDWGGKKKPKTAADADAAGSAPAK
jgi:hypothetical protein